MGDITGCPPVPILRKMKKGKGGERESGSRPLPKGGREETQWPLPKMKKKLNSHE